MCCQFLARFLDQMKKTARGDHCNICSARSLIFQAELPVSWSLFLVFSGCFFYVFSFFFSFSSSLFSLRPSFFLSSFFFFFLGLRVSFCSSDSCIFLVLHLCLFSELSSEFISKENRSSGTSFNPFCFFKILEYASVANLLKFSSSEKQNACC